MILNDFQISALCVDLDPLVGPAQMITPFVGRQCREQGDRKVISYGLTSFGYDVRLAPTFAIFSNVNSGVIDPKCPDERNLHYLEVLEDGDGSRYVIMPPNSYGLGHTIEWFNIPRDVNVVCVGKSTYARSAIQVNVTPIEAGFCGTVVIELANNSGCPAKIYLEEGIAQFQFYRGEECDVSYADRNGKYQNQSGLVLSRV